MILASYNIHFAIGLDGRHDLDRIADKVRVADIVCFQEVGQHWRRNDFADQAERLAACLGYHAVFGAAFDVDASYRDASGNLVNRRRRFGNMVASRWPIRSTRTEPLPKPPVPAVFDLHRCLVEAVVETPFGDLRVYSVHLSHSSQHRRLVQIARLLDFVRRAPTEGSAWDHLRLDEDWTEGWETPTLPRPAILAGDLNCVADSPEFAELLRPTGAVGETESDADMTLYDAWALAGNPRSEGISLAGRKPGYRIDHVLVSGSLCAMVRRSWIERDGGASDHFPMFAELDLGLPLHALRKLSENSAREPPKRT